MGGHSAWRKRVANGELAKQYGGAIGRHRPHFGRKGKDLILNRKGHIGKGNPKKRRNLGVASSKQDENWKYRKVKKASISRLPLTVVSIIFLFCIFLKLCRVLTMKNI